VALSEIACDVTPPPHDFRNCGYAVGRLPVSPGYDVLESTKVAALTRCWVRPVKSESRVGEHRALTWKLV
jgi:hypothetical protein